MRFSYNSRIESLNLPGEGWAFTGCDLQKHFRRVVAALRENFLYSRNAATALRGAGQLVGRGSGIAVAPFALDLMPQGNKWASQEFRPADLEVCATKAASP